MFLTESEAAALLRIHPESLGAWSDLGQIQQAAQLPDGSALYPLTEVTRLTARYTAAEIAEAERDMYEVTEWA